MGYGDYCWGLYRDYYGDPFPHSSLSTRENFSNAMWELGGLPPFILYEGHCSGSDFLAPLSQNCRPFLNLTSARFEGHLWD